MRKSTLTLEAQARLDAEVERYRPVKVEAGLQPVRIPKVLSRRYAPTLADRMRAIIKRNGPTAGWFIK